MKCICQEVNSIFVCLTATEIGLAKVLLVMARHPNLSIVILRDILRVVYLAALIPTLPYRQTYFPMYYVLC